MSGTKEITTGPARVARDVVEFRGHRMVRATHPTTIEVTTEEYLSEEGDCIIGVGATKGCAGLNLALKEGLRKRGAVVTVRVYVGGESFTVRGSGDPKLTLTDPHEIVIRRSDFTSGRTLAVGADVASRDMPREMVRLLKNPAMKGRLEVEVS